MKQITRKHCPGLVNKITIILSEPEYLFFKLFLVSNIIFILTESMLKNVIYKTIYIFESSRKHAQADIICYWKMTSVMALDGVTSFSCLKDVTNTSKRM